jgi:glucan endo-1,3-alpha-glucosidase
MDLAVPFIKAYKAGGNAPVVEGLCRLLAPPAPQVGVMRRHRPGQGQREQDVQPGGVPAGKPQGWEFVADVVFVAVSSKAGAKVTVTSGSNAPVTLDAQAGIQVFEVPMGTGQQKFELSSGAGSASGTSEVPITAGCWQDKLYNFNFHSGLVSA